VAGFSRTVGAPLSPDRPPEEVVNKSRSTQRPRRPPRRNA